MVLEDKFNSSARGKKFLPMNRRAERSWQGDFTFIQAADTQFGMQESYIEKKADFGWNQEISWSQELVRQVNSMTPRPRFMVICGDLLDAWPETQGEIRKKQEVDFKNVFQDLRVPCVCVCGNHDIGNQPTMESVSRYRSSFGNDYFSFWCGGVYFLVLNTQYYEDSSKVPELAEQQEIWLQEELKKVKKRKPKHAVVFQHIPLFLRTPNEDKEYFNFAPEPRHRLLERFYEAGIRHVFSGHYHRNAGGWYRDLQMVVTSAVGAQLGDDNQGYRLCRVTERGVDHEYRLLDTLTALPAVVPYTLLRQLLDRFGRRDEDREEFDKPPKFLLPALGARRLKAA